MKVANLSPFRSARATGVALNILAPVGLTIVWNEKRSKEEGGGRGRGGSHLEVIRWFEYSNELSTPQIINSISTRRIETETTKNEFN